MGKLTDIAPASWGHCPQCGDITHIARDATGLWAMCAAHIFAWRVPDWAAGDVPAGAWCDAPRAAMLTHLLEDFVIIAHDQAHLWGAGEWAAHLAQQAAEAAAWGDLVHGEAV